jgi:type I restriction enzyme M protein
MDHQTHNQIVNFIWNIADDCLQDIYRRGEYRNIILPITVIRRLDAVLEPTKQKVLGMKKNLEKARLKNMDAACAPPGRRFATALPLTCGTLPPGPARQNSRRILQLTLMDFLPMSRK